MPKFQTRTFRLVGEPQRIAAGALLQNLPVDSKDPLEVVFREPPKGRTLDQNALMWAGPLKDIEEQAWLMGKQYAAEVWHEYFKEQYLPDEAEEQPDELAKRVKDPEKYRKWMMGPSGRRLLVGSTTELTKFGFAEYLEQVLAEGGGLGVRFSAKDAA